MTLDPIGIAFTRFILNGVPRLPIKADDRISEAQTSFVADVIEAFAYSVRSAEDNLSIHRTFTERCRSNRSEARPSVCRIFGRVRSECGSSLSRKGLPGATTNHSTIATLGATWVRDGSAWIIIIVVPDPLEYVAQHVEYAKRIRF